MSEYLTTKELAELLRIKERKVYDLAASGAVPCSRATGKLLFPRRDINDWIASNASGGEAAQRPEVIVGSHDPLLEWALRESRCGLASYFDSSLDGLERFASGDGIATGLHVFDPPSQGWNLAQVTPRFAQQRVVLVSWAMRQRGLIVAPGAAKQIRQLGDLAGKKLVPRQPEAGSQVLLEALLSDQAVKHSTIKWSAAARSEVDAVLEVLEGRADAAFGLAALAEQYRLDFVPLIDERYDLLVERRAWFEPAWQTLLAFCQGQAFKKRAKSLAGYNIAELFQVRFNSN